MYKCGRLQVAAIGSCCLLPTINTRCARCLEWDKERASDERLAVHSVLGQSQSVMGMNLLADNVWQGHVCALQSCRAFTMKSEARRTDSPLL